MSKANSPSYAQGLADGQRDAQLIADGKAAHGPQPPNPAYPVMYNRGYQDGLNGG